MSDDDLRDLWTTDPAPLATLSAEEARVRAAKLRRSVTTRNVVEWAAAALVVVLFARMGLENTGLIAAGAWCTVGAATFIGVRLWRKGRLRALPDATQDGAAFLSAHRANLLAQARLLATAGTWYVAPIAVGLALMLAGHLPRAGAETGAWAVWVGSCVFVLLVCAGVWVINQRGAASLRAEAARLADCGAIADRAIPSQGCPDRRRTVV